MGRDDVLIFILMIQILTMSLYVEKNLLLFTARMNAYGVVEPLISHWLFGYGLNQCMVFKDFNSRLALK